MKSSFCIRALLLLVVIGILTGSCNKQDFLNKPPSTNLIVPSSLNDFQNLLDNDQVMGQVPALGEISADNYYLAYGFWQSLGKRVHNAYIWAPDIFGGEGNVEDWNYSYQQVYYANVVLDGMANQNAGTGSMADWNNVLGQALFTRAFAFYNIAQVFAPAYDNVTAASDTGILLRLHQDVVAPSIISTVKQTYNQITGDLRKASGLLPPTVSMTYLNRASRPAAQALLARVYLSMRKYDSAKLYTDSALLSNPTLIDYNSLKLTAPIPIAKQNAEILYQANFVNYADKQILTGYSFPDCFIDTTLLHSYDINDLRLSIYYYPIGADSFNLKGSYAGSVLPFGGLAVDELYLTRAECKIRSGDVNGGIQDVNVLLRKRWKTGTFTDYSPPTSQAVALDTVLLERRKELAFRGLRWTDLRRLNKEGANIIPSRRINGTVYTLAPNSNLYTLPIPPDVQQLSGIHQKPR